MIHPMKVVVIPPDRHLMLVERFLSYVDKNGPIPEHNPELGRCWLWLGATVTGGYGVFNIDHRKDVAKRIQVRAHRAAWLLLKGEIRDGAQLCHHCDNPACVNVEHLYEGDHTTNSADKARRKRAAWERNANHKLTWAAVRIIRQALRGVRWHDRWRKYRPLAERYGVDPHIIGNVFNNRCWKEEDDPERRVQ